MKLQFDNRGGIAYMYALPPECLNRIRRNFGDDDTFSPEFVKSEKMIKVPCYAGSSHKFVEKKTLGEDGESYSLEISGVVPAHLMARNELKKLSKGRWLVVFQDKMGEIRMSGTKEIPLYFDYNDETGGQVTELNGYKFSFVAKQAKPSLVCVQVDLRSL